MENVVSKNLSFDPLEYFDGETTAWGLIVDRFGNSQRTFKVRLNGNIDNKQLLLKEYFTYNDGETEYREWIITKTETGTYEGKSKDKFFETTFSILELEHPVIKVKTRGNMKRVT
jgi:5-hydroxyisourate hydrolase-like protein (transthyretin family)